MKGAVEMTCTLCQCRIEMLNGYNYKITISWASVEKPMS